MKALSVRQPWPWCMEHLGKDIENRSWWTPYRGPLLIHAAKGMTRADYEDCLATIHHISRAHPFPEGVTLPPFANLPRGGIVGQTTLVDCVAASKSPWFFGRNGFVLRDFKPLPFRPCKGALGLFEVDAA